ncbi:MULTISPECIES: copper-binding protein [Erythrobacteraceae]|uniref:Cu(I)/Ag(I) efflux system protein CusF n=1 Tax=Altererythrobacter xiamenensis TaxID=1316679 RepID=A0A1Y6FI07_9SPHN|nr:MULTISPECIES: copper-binding protein [Erythrobacteraceae]SMQ73996.1 Cu(I)/Ag(I) efflux system protein CusF [Altererythrobacter xiamenensis]
MRTTTLMSLLAFPLALAACDSGQDTADMNDMPMAENEMMMDGEDMPMMEPGSEMQTVSAEGTVTAIDAEAGTITVDHGPVPAIEWPAMTMAFEADEQLRSEVSVGEGIAFEFRTGSEGSVITSITKE